MRRSELHWCLGYALVLAGLTTLPYVVAATRQGEAWRFTGFLFAVEDGNSYIGKMRRGNEGEWLFRSPYTTMEQRGVIAFAPYLLIGKLAGSEPSHARLVLLFHAFRVLAIPLAVLASYRFAGLFVQTESLQKWMTVLATAGGGLGWALILAGEERWLGSLALDFYSPEAFGFLSFYGIPHLILARAALLYALIWYLEAGEYPSRIWWSGGALLALALVQPISLLAAGAAMIAHSILMLGMASGCQRRREWAAWLRRGIRTLLIPGPFMAYLAYAYFTDPYLQAWGRQNLIPSPHPLHYAAAYAPMLPPAAYGAWKVIRRAESASTLPVAWALAAPALAYAPVAVQRRLTEGLWMAILVLAARGLSEWESKRRLTRLLLAMLSLPSSLLLLIGGMLVTAEPGPPAYRSSREVQAFEALGSTASAGDIVLGSFATGNALPAWAAVRVVVGHGPESAGLAELLPQTEAFFAEGMGAQDRKQILVDQQVDYVFYGPYESAYGDWDPSRAEYLDLRYANEGYSFFAVAPLRLSDDS